LESNTKTCQTAKPKYSLQSASGATGATSLKNAEIIRLILHSEMPVVFRGTKLEMGQYHDIGIDTGFGFDKSTVMA